MTKALKTLSNALKVRFPIRYFGGHIEYGDTYVCPGSNLLPIVQKMREEFGLSALIHRSL